MTNLKNIIITGLAAVYLGLTASPALGQDDTTKIKYTLADKATCLSLSSEKLDRNNLTCFKNLAGKIQKYDGWQYRSGKGTAGSKDGRLSPLEYATAIIDDFLSWNEGCNQKGECKVPKTMITYMVGDTIRTEAIPADVNGDCYLSPADDLNGDGNITLEDLTAYQATATSSNPKIKCNYEKTEKTK